MKRNDGIDFEPDANGAGRDGFREGDPDAEPVVNASEVNAVFLNQIQEEVCRAIELLNGTLSGANVQQLGERIVAMLDGTGTFVTPVVRTKYFNASALQFTHADGVANWTIGTNSNQSAASSEVGTSQVAAFLPLSGLIPDGCTITKVRVLVDPSTAHTTASDRMAVNLRSFSASGTTVSVATTSGPFRDDGTNALQWIDSGTISHARTTANTWAELEIASSVAALDQVYLIEITYSDAKPGER